MNASVLNRRRIERYAQLLDEAKGARRHHARLPIDDELANMLTAGKALTAVKLAVEPSDEFRRDTRAMLLACAERDGIGATAKSTARELITTTPPAIGRASVGTVHESASRRRLFKTQGGSKARLTTSRSRARAAILIGLAVGTLALSGISAASGNAMPGDALYGMKRSAEDAQITLARTPVEKGGYYLDFASTRLGEAEQAKPTSDTIKVTMATMDSQTTIGAKLLLTDAFRHRDMQALTTLDQFTVEQRAQLNDWLKELGSTGSTYAYAIHSMSILDQIHVRSNEIKAALNCSSSPTLLGTDRFGPEPSCTGGD